MRAPSERLILFTRYPEPDRTKTRLIPVLGAEGAAELQRRLTLFAVRASESFCSERRAQLQIVYAGADEQVMSHWLGDRFSYSKQPEGDLGDRMQAAFAAAFNEGCEAVVLIGSDCPEVNPKLLAEAFDALRTNAAVIGPATDGGYYLVGLREPLRELFSGPIWGSDSVLAESLRILDGRQRRYHLLPHLSDIDRPEDLQGGRALDEQTHGRRRLSVIIPALDEQQRIAGAVESALAGKPHEVLVVDGGSTDRTTEAAARSGALVLRSGRGRSRQMNAGASRAAGEFLLFVHADTLVPPGYVQAITTALARPSIAAGAFAFAVRENFPGRLILEYATNLRSRFCQMPYGDQGLFLRREDFEELGGYSDMPILEDYDLVKRLRRRGRILTLRQRASTSGRRWAHLGFWRTTFINQRILLGYRRGLPLQSLEKLYRVGNGEG